MKTKPVVVDASKNEDWLQTCVRLFEQGQPYRIIGSGAQIEEYLQFMKERQPKKTPPEIMFSLELAPKDLVSE
ncbi:MAG TPA: hypothetical protein VEC99_01610 [Clostridia bacterium]|nr:hypothetical protein [Clostridia bacterium]